MFTRIVKMEFDAQHVSTFLNNFEEVKSRIRQYPGCRHLELWRDKRDPTIFFTYSHWDREEDLESYRHSPLFKSVWATTKPLFRSKAQAWSVDTLHQLA
ncbi:antibiotic biosynthesis monooxygenase [Aureisphaera galaxeae]|uniref:putative quinol monooxygenase n=1 Tax=Aureisphaera galaxeae TaxID=1538023 RepID=UPI002350C1DB|nr:antibiotic biosynthesis monooxygenase family protein [Aureisphaera galaxeae]MDC8004538.1 antibiotic biosynthesis monooxygenase [Aureisphaera galaxeae]